MGDSVGRWDGDTLVIETVNLTDRTWLDDHGNRHSDALRVTERWRRMSANELWYQATIDDAKFYTKPWTTGWVIPLAPKEWEIMEYACTDNNKDLYDGHLQPGSLDGSGRDGTAIALLRRLACSETLGRTHRRAACLLIGHGHRIAMRYLARAAARSRPLAIHPGCSAWLVLGAVAHEARGHPAPFSYLDLHLDADRTSGTLVIHDFDAAHELRLEDPQALLEPGVARERADELLAIVGGRLRIVADGEPAALQWQAVEVLAERQSLSCAFTFTRAARPGHIEVDAVLFPYDPIHQTFINVYEAGGSSARRSSTRTTAASNISRARPRAGGRSCARSSFPASSTY